MTEKLKPIELLPIKFDVAKIAKFLEGYPSWNRFKHRTYDPKSPHHYVDDIWARFGDLNDENVKTNKKFDSYWYEPELRELLEPIIFTLNSYVGGTELGGVLITRVPAGKSVRPHKDFGWHAEYYSKFCVCIAANREQSFCYDGIEMRTITGEVFRFFNQETHWVNNPSTEDRISAIVCIRTEQSPR